MAFHWRLFNEHGNPIRVSPELHQILKLAVTEKFQNHNPLVPDYCHILPGFTIFFENKPTKDERATLHWFCAGIIHTHVPTFHIGDKVKTLIEMKAYKDGALTAHEIPAGTEAFIVGRDEDDFILKSDEFTTYVSPKEIEKIIHLNVVN